MKKAVKLLVCVNTIFAFLMLVGCQKENGNNNGGSGGENYEEPTIVSTREVNNDGFVIVEALFDDNSKMYFRLLTSNIAEVTNWKSFYGSESNEGYVYRGDLVIPSELTHSGVTYQIAGIQSEAFMDCTLLNSIVVPSSVTYIGSKAFQGCSGLISVNVPNSIKGISSYTFAGCSSLVSFTIPDSTDYIGEGAFCGCSSLESIIIPDNVSGIAGGTNESGNFRSGAFENCTKLQSVVIGNSLEIIGKRTFWNCQNLIDVVIGDAVTFIDNGAFYYCSSLTAITIPEAVTKLGQYVTAYNDWGVFENCSNLTSIELSDSLSFIGDKTFFGCLALTSIEIPQSVKVIGRGAFAYTGLNSVVIPNSVINVVGDTSNVGYIGTFENCKHLVSTTIGSSVNRMSLTFKDCSELKTVTCLAVEPPQLFHTFDQCDLEVIYVPIESVDRYKNDDNWREYADVIVGF